MEENKNRIDYFSGMADEKKLTKGQKKYYAFLASPKWREIREKVLAIHGKMCSNCGSPSNLHIHHKRYTRKGGKEDIWRDLVVLCRHCHQAHHGLLTPEGRKAFEDARIQRREERLRNQKPRRPKPIRVRRGKLIVQVPELVTEKVLAQAQAKIARLAQVRSANGID